jgi:hypothetical protein
VRWYIYTSLRGQVCARVIAILSHNNVQVSAVTLVIVFNRLIEVIGSYFFRIILLRGLLIHFNFNLNFIKYTIVKIKI